MPALVQLEHVTRIYRMGEIDVVALSDVSLEIPRGQFVSIMGASGSGKSTLMNVIGCLDRATSGRYLLDGIDVSQLSRNQLARIRNETIGFVFQHFNLLARTSARENVEVPLIYADVPARERRERALHALARVGMADRAEHQPNQLSGGQQQRVAIARALVNGPKLILADEPTGALDSRAGMDVMQLFQELGASGITIAVVTHEADIARCAERTLTMRDGRIVSDLAQRPVAAVTMQARVEARA
ncbi:MAG TPA: ABC transporter ATP-binding protein [Kofleriaceae bacterium]|nr:ABC transporter ATP-binding protein [Kofleriaceae bacterium]